MSTKCYPKNCCRIWKRVGWLAVHEDNYSQLYPKAEFHRANVLCASQTEATPERVVINKTYRWCER